MDLQAVEPPGPEQLYAAKEGAVQEKAAIQIKRFNRNKVCAFILCTCYPHLSYST